MVDKVYDALMAPEPEQVALPEPETVAKQLPPTFVENLGLNLVQTEEQEPDWPLMISKLQEGKGFTEVETEDMDRFMHLVPAHVRRRRLEDLETLARNSGKEWSVKTFNYFLSEYLAARKLDRVKDLFHEMVDKSELSSFSNKEHLLIELREPSRYYRELPLSLESLCSG